MFKKKHLLYLFLIILVGCSPANPSEPMKPYLIFAAPFEEQPVWDKAKIGFLQACEDLDYHCDWKGPSVISAEYMENVIEEAIIKKADGIITQGVVDSAIINKAHDAGIPVVLVDADVEESERIGFFTKDFEAQANLLIQDILSKGQFETMHIAIQVAELDFDIAQKQIDTIQKEIERYHPEHEIVAVSESKSDPIRARSEWRRVLSADDNINVIINFAGESAQEAAIVVEALGLEDILIYGVDEMAETLALIQSGKIEGTVVTSFYDYGYNAVLMHQNHLEGGTIDNTESSVRIRLINNETIAAYLEETSHD